MFLDDDVALEAVERAVADGADAVDIGGVKAGPGPEVTPPRSSPGWCRSSRRSARRTRS